MSKGHQQRSRKRAGQSTPAKKRTRGNPSHFRVDRHEPSWTLAGATRFTDERLLGDHVEVVRLFQEHCPDICELLIEATTPERERSVGGRPRMGGSWALVFLAHILTGHPDWQAFYDQHQSSSELWDICGFERVPSWQTLYLRFAELEHPRCVAAFTEAANCLIRIAAANEPRAFRHIHTDGTAAHTHAMLEHKCPSPEHCQRASRLYGEKRLAKMLARASENDINDERHERSAEPEPENPNLPPANKLRKLTDEEAQAHGLGDWRVFRYFVLNGHVLRCADKDVGARLYRAQAGKRKRKFWVGEYFLPAVCDFFKAPVAVHFFEADTQEHLGWEKLYGKLLKALGTDQFGRQRKPISVIADKAFNNKPFIGFNTHEGVASITPERKLPGGKDVTNLRGEHWDEHAPRCKHCGGPCSPMHLGGKNVGFFVTGAGDPRLRYRCAYEWFDECRKPQTISCRKELRALLPISRQAPLFHELLDGHKSFESIFDSWRDRYAVAGTSMAGRTKRRGSMAAQKLRASAALLAEWFRICMREGYLGNNACANKQSAVKRDGGQDKVDRRIRKHRRQHRLDLPMGPIAEAKGVAGSHPEDKYIKAAPSLPDDDPPF